MAKTGHGKPVNKVGAFYVPAIGFDTADHTTVLRIPNITKYINKYPLFWTPLGSSVVLLSPVVTIPFVYYDYSKGMSCQKLIPSFVQPYNNSLYTVTVTLMGQAWI